MLHRLPLPVYVVAAAVLMSGCSDGASPGVASNPSDGGTEDGAGGPDAAGGAAGAAGTGGAGGAAGTGGSSLGGAAGSAGQGGDAGDASVPDGQVPPPAPWDKMLFEERFEGQEPLNSPYVLDVQTAALAHSLQYTNELAFEGTKSLRLELRDSDPEVASGTRAEVVMQPATARDRWCAFAAYFPAEAWAPDNYAEAITQWHSFPDEHLGETWASPATKMLVYKGKLRFDVGYNDAPDSNVILGDVKYDLGPVVTDVWREFVIHIYHSHASDGLVEVWLDGQKVVEHKGGNAFNDDGLPFWKFGLYKWDWNGAKTTDVSKRVLFLDHVRMAGP
jgi:hypothetical protein